MPVTFDGSGSFDPDGNIISYDWDFGDGVTGIGENPTHTYLTKGIYTVSLTVTDNDGFTDTSTMTITIGVIPVPVPLLTPLGVIVLFSLIGIITITILNYSKK